MGRMSGILAIAREAMTSDEAYASLPAVLAEELGGTSLWIQDFHGTEFAGISASYGIDPALAAPYEAHFYDKDPWLHFGASVPLGTAALCDEFVPRAVFESSEIYNDLCRPNGDIFYCAGLFVPTVQGAARYGVIRVRSQPAFSSEIVAQLEQVLPSLALMHLTRDRRNAIARQPAIDAPFDSGAPDARFLVSRSGHIAFQNRAASELETGCAFTTAPNATLRLLSPESQAKLHQALALATRGVDAGSTLLTADRPGRSSVLVAVDPFPQRGDLAMVTIRDCDRFCERQAERAALCFGLTHAESALAAALFARKSPEQIASQRGVSLSTVRTQLRSLYAKADVRGVAEFIAACHALP